VFFPGKPFQPSQMFSSGLEYAKYKPNLFDPLLIYGCKRFILLVPGTVIFFLISAYSVYYKVYTLK